VYFLADGHRYQRTLYESEDFSFIAYEDMREVLADGREVRINGKVVIKGQLQNSAKNIVRLIRRVKNSKPARREEAIRTILGEATNLEELRAFKRKHEDSLFYVKLLGTTLFAHMFILLPLALYSQPHFYIHLPLLMVFMGVNYLLILIGTLFVLRKFHRAEIGPEPHTILSIIFFPPSAVHLLNNLTRNMYAQFDYLTIAADLLRPHQFKHLFRRELEHVAYVKDQSADPAFEEFWTLREASLHGLLAQVGIPVREIFAVPEKQDQSAASYCPLCSTEYMSGFNKCNDCGVDLKQFE